MHTTLLIGKLVYFLNFGFDVIEVVLGILTLFARVTVLTCITSVTELDRTLGSLALVIFILFHSHVVLRGG